MHDSPAQPLNLSMATFLPTMEQEHWHWLLLLLSMLLILLAPTLRVANRKKDNARPTSGGAPTRNTILVSDGAVAHRALVQHGAAFLDRPASNAASALLSRFRHLNILSSSYGTFWSVLRHNLAVGTLHPSRLRRLADARRNAISALIADLSTQHASKTGGVVNAGDSLHYAVFSLLALMCFGDEPPVGKARMRAMHALQKDVLVTFPRLTVFGTSFPRLASLVYRERWNKLLSLRQRQEDLFLSLIEERRHRRSNAADGCVQAYVDTLFDVKLPDSDGGERCLTDGEFVSLCSEFLGAGTETTTSTLQWIMANLALNPNTQRRLREEVDAVVAATGNGAVHEADLKQMPYLRAVVIECLRRRSPVPVVQRHITEVGGVAIDGLEAPQGAVVSFMLGEIGRDEKSWTAPMEFRPERFLPGGEGEGVRLTASRETKMMPFGAGRRICPGLGLAMLHVEYFVANLVREFEWSEADGETVSLAEDPASPFCVMKYPLKLRLVPRIMRG